MYFKVLVTISFLVVFPKLILSELFFDSFEISSDNDIFTIYNYTKVDGNKTNSISMFGRLNKVCVRAIVSFYKV
jgi:hypothetical protein